MSRTLPCEICHRPVHTRAAALAVDARRALCSPPARWLLGHSTCLWRVGAFYQLDPGVLLDPERRKRLEARLAGKRWWPHTCGWAEALDRLGVLEAEERRCSANG